MSLDDASFEPAVTGVTALAAFVDPGGIWSANQTTCDTPSLRVVCLEE